MSTWHFFDLATGKFSGRTYAGPQSHLDANLPAGSGAVLGVTDWMSQCVGLGAGALMDHQPPAPQSDELRTWSWDAAARRWISAPTLAALKAPRIAEVQLAIEAQERAQDRPQRELMAAFRLSLPAPAFAANKMAAIDVEIARLRALRGAIVSAQNRAQLDAVPRP